MLTQYNLFFFGISKVKNFIPFHSVRFFQFVCVGVTRNALSILADL